MLPSRSPARPSQRRTFQGAARARGQRVAAQAIAKTTCPAARESRATIVFYASRKGPSWAPKGTSEARLCRLAFGLSGGGDKRGLAAARFSRLFVLFIGTDDLLHKPVTNDVPPRHLHAANALNSCEPVHR